MIQRIQSLYLLLSAICSGSIFGLSFGSFETAKGELEYEAWAVVGESSTTPFGTWPVAALVGLVVVLNLITLVLYKKRGLQNRLNVFAMLLMLATPALAFFYGTMASEKFAVALQYGIAFVLPLVSLILTFLAYKAIAKDDKLVRSLDRIR